MLYSIFWCDNKNGHGLVIILPKLFKVESKTVTPFPILSRKGIDEISKIIVRQTYKNSILKRTFSHSFPLKKEEKEEEEVNRPFNTTEKQEHKSHPKTKIKK